MNFSFFGHFFEEKSFFLKKNAFFLEKKLYFFIGRGILLINGRKMPKGIGRIHI